MLYTFLRNILAVVYRVVFRFEVIGQENIPKSGGVILCSNHRSNNDAVFLAICQKRQINFMAKDSLFKIPVLGYLLKKVGSFPVKRGSGDITAVRKAVEVLKEGKMLCIFPEGTRNRVNNELLEFKTGAAFIAYKAEASIVPCAISGKIKPFSKIRVSFGSPFNIDTSGGKPNVDSETLRLKSKIAELYSV